MTRVETFDEEAFNRILDVTSEATSVLSREVLKELDDMLRYTGETLERRWELTDDEIQSIIM